MKHLKAILLVLFLFLQAQAKEVEIVNVPILEPAAIQIVVDHLRMKLQQSPEWLEWDREFQDWWTVQDVRGDFLVIR